MPTRKSDVSVARFVLADDEDSAMTTETPAPEAAEPSVSGSTPAAQSQPSDKKDKEKEKNKEKESDNLTIEDLTLPKSIITRLAKGVLPPNTQIQANAILALTKGATVFINHLANAANEFTVSSNKKTIMPADVFKALDDIEYGFMREKLEAEFAKFNEIQTSKRSTYRKKVAAAKKGTTGADASQSQSGLTADTSMMSLGSATHPDDGGADDETVDRSMQQQQQQEGHVRAAKKAKIDPAAAEGSAKMEVDEQEVSDAETVPDEQQEEEEDEEDDEVEEEEDEEDDDENEGGAADGERDDLEERTAREDGDEALDDDSD